MAEALESKIHPASPHRRELARQDGQVAKSHELPAALLLLAGSLALVYYGDDLTRGVTEYARGQFGGQAWLTADTAAAVGWWHAAMQVMAGAAAPFLGAMLLIAAAAHVGQAGLLLQPARLVPEPGRLDPVANLQRLCSGANGARWAFANVRAAAVGGVVLWCAWDGIERWLAVGTLPAGMLVAELLGFVTQTCAKAATALVALGLADYGYQRWRLERSLAMSDAELREELRNQRGDSAILSRRRYLQRHLSLTSVREAVAQADLVVAAGSTLAVALRYDPATMPAPMVIAKGQGHVADEIRRTAEQHAVQIEEHRALARELHQQTTAGDSISAEHFAAVAQAWPKPR